MFLTIDQGLVKVLSISIVLLLSSVISFGQKAEYAPHINSVENTIKAINSKDYTLLKKQWGPLGRMIVPKKKLALEFDPLLKEYGELCIDTILFASKYSATAQIQTASTKRLFFRFIFNDNGKLQGLGLGHPTFTYKRNQITTSQKSLHDKIDSIVQSRIDKKEPYKFNGALLVSQGDSIIFKKSSGSLNFNSNETLNDSSIFLLASCSKQFTAVAIMKLKEMKLVGLDQTVKEILPEFPYRNITVRNLLCHTSGLPDYFSLIMKHWDPNTYVSNSDILNLFARYEPKLLFEPNERFSYSNSGYIILSLIVERLSGQTYGQYLKENIFDPLNMSHTYVYHRRIARDTLENYAIGNIYSYSEKKYILPDSSEHHRYVSFMDGLTGDDGVSSTILDLMKWNSGLKNHTILSESSTTEMVTNHVLDNGIKTNYGFGIFLRSGESIQNTEYHTGGWPGYSTMILRLTELDKSIILLSNNEYNYFDTLVDEIAFLLSSNNKRNQQ